MRSHRARLGIAIVAAGLLAGTTAGVTLAGDRSDRGGNSVSARLSGYNEDPLTVSTTGNGSFRARIDESRDRIRYRLFYNGLEGSVTQAHIHFGGQAQSGGISVFLCTNLGNGPVGTQECPAAPALVTGTIVAVDVLGPATQGIEPGEFDELVDAIRAETAYVNVHSTLYPGGEIRSQLERHGHHHHH